jgi:aldehyde:ferredoxin oxidoreductase
VVNEKAIAVSDISGHCDWLSDRVPSLSFWWGEEEIAPAISAVTGMECTPELMVDAHKRRRLLEYTHMKMSAAAFNIDDGMPMKLVMPRPDGQYAGAEFAFEKLPQVILGYFKHMGIDPDTHMPLRSELERLGLNDVADRLEEKGLVEKQPDPEEAKPKNKPKQKKRKKSEKVV